MVLVLIPFAALGVFVAVIALLLQRNIKRATRATGTVVGKRFVPSHAGLTPSGTSGGRSFVAPDSWVLEIETGGKRGTAVVSEAEYDALAIGDFYSGPKGSDS